MQIFQINKNKAITLFNGMIKGKRRIKWRYMFIQVWISDGINWFVQLGRRLTVKTVGNSHRKPHIQATGRYCDETVDGAEL